MTHSQPTGRPSRPAFVFMFCLATADPLHAQDQPGSDAAANDRVMETVIVRGQKRDRSLQESDLSVTVFDESAIRETRLRDIRRIDDLVPNVQFNEAGQLSSVFVSIRGIESNPFIVNRAAIYIDGIPFRELSNAVLNQISSIEVLRGPQSTLYGANSEAGLLLITTRQPQEEFEGQLRFTTSTYNGDVAYGVDGFLGGALIEDRLQGSIAFKASQDDAFVSNAGAADGETGEVRDLFLQGRLRFTPNEDFVVNATAYILDTDAPGLFDQDFVPLDRTLYDATYQDLFNGGRSIDRFEFIHDAPKHTEEQNVVTGLSSTYFLTRGAIDTALSYASREEESYGLDLDSTAFPSVAGGELEDEEIWSAELRFSSPDSDVFEYLVGASWYREEDETRLGTGFGQPATLAEYSLTPLQSNRAEDFALFASMTAALGVEGLRGTLGLRFDHAERETRQEAGILDLGFAQLVFQDIALDETYEALLPRFALSYRYSDSLNLFASASRGYIPGGFNLAAADIDLADEVTSYDKESIWSYEAGFKYQYPNARGYLNFAAFYIESDNWQEVQVLFDDEGRVVSTAFISADASIESIGFEIETLYSFTPNLKLTAAYGYADANYRDFQVSETENLDGNSVKLVPEYDANIALRYESSSGFFCRGELSRTGDTPLNERASSVQESVTVVNLQAGYEGDAFSLRLFAENLTDERVFTGLAFPNTAGDDGNEYAPLGPPRIVGVELELNF
ncbi:MAG: TonB-dependent receptor [Pseudomonadota bacterium]